MKWKNWMVVVLILAATAGITLLLTKHGLGAVVVLVVIVAWIVGSIALRR